MRVRWSSRLRKAVDSMMVVSRCVVQVMEGGLVECYGKMIMDACL